MKFVTSLHVAFLYAMAIAFPQCVAHAQDGNAALPEVPDAVVVWLRAPVTPDAIDRLPDVIATACPRDEFVDLKDVSATEGEKPTLFLSCPSGGVAERLRVVGAHDRAPGRIVADYDAYKDAVRRQHAKFLDAEKTFLAKFPVESDSGSVFVSANPDRAQFADMTNASISIVDTFESDINSAMPWQSFISVADPGNQASEEERRVGILEHRRTIAGPEHDIPGDIYLSGTATVVDGNLATRKSLRDSNQFLNDRSFFSDYAFPRGDHLVRVVALPAGMVVYFSFVMDCPAPTVAYAIVDKKDAPYFEHIIRGVHERQMYDFVAIGDLPQSQRDRFQTDHDIMMRAR